MQFGGTDLTSRIRNYSKYYNKLIADNSFDKA